MSKYSNYCVRGMPSVIHIAWIARMKYDGRALYLKFNIFDNEKIFDLRRRLNEIIL